MATGVTIRSLLVKLGFDADTKEGEEFQDQMTSIEDGMGELVNKAKGFALAFGASVAAAFGVAAVKEFLSEQQEAVLQIEKRRGAIAATAEEMQKLGFVARESGFEMDELSDAIADLAEKAADAELTGAGYKENLDLLGISATDTAGKMKSPIQLFLEFADAMKGLEEGGKKTFIAMDLMGDAGKNMLPLLNLGSGGIKDMMEAADAAGFVMTDSTIAATVEYSEASRRLTDAIVLLKSTALDKLLPIITAITKRITAWLMNTDNIAAALLRLRQAAIVTGAALAAMAVGRIARAFTQLPALITTVVNGMRSLRAMLLSTNAAMIAIPLAIAGILLAGQDLFAWVSGGDSLIGRFIDKWAESDGILGSVARTIQGLKPVAEKMFAVLSDAASKILPALSDMFAQFGDVVTTTIGPAVTKVVKALVETFKEMAPIIADLAAQTGQVVAKVLVMAAKVVAALSITVIPTIKSLLPIVVTVVNGILSLVSALLPAVSFVLGAIGAIIQGLAPIVQGVIGTITNIIVVLAALIAEIIQGIVDIVGPVIITITGGITDAVDIIGGALSTLIGWFQTAFDAIAEIIKPVSDSLGAVIKGVQSITGGASVLQTVARAAPRGAAGQAALAAGGSSNRSSNIDFGGLTLQIGGSTNAGPTEIRNSTREGMTQALMDAERRQTAKEVA